MRDHWMEDRIVIAHQAGVGLPAAGAEIGGPPVRPAAACGIAGSQAKIDAELEKRTLGLVVLPPPSPAKPKTKTAKTADVAPDDDGVS